jgi:hypothetical protein
VLIVFRVIVATGIFLINSMGENIQLMFFSSGMVGGNGTTEIATMDSSRNNVDMVLGHFILSLEANMRALG